MAQKITIDTVVNAPVATAWKAFTTPADIMAWNHASDDWHCPKATNDVRVGGMLTARMEAKDGSMGFDFGGTYTEVTPNEWLVYTMDGPDGRTVEIGFEDLGDGKTRVTETFDAETQNPVEMQKQGWQAILGNYKKHAESLRS